MPELDLNYDLPWMQQAPDSNKPMSLAEAFQLRQRQQQIDAEKALLPLRMQEMNQQIANAALDHTIKQEHQHMLLKTKDADQSAWADLAKIKDPSDPAQQAEWFKGRALKPWMSQEVSQFAQATFKNADLNNKTAQTLQNKLDIELMKTPRSEDTASVKNAKERLSAYKASLSATGGKQMTPGEEAVKYQQFVDEQTALPNEDTKVELGPGGTVQSITTHRGAGGKTGPTVATETKAQTDLMRYQGVVQLLENMTSQLRPQDVGVAGKIGSFQNRILGQIGLGGDMSVSSNRAQAEGALTDFLQSQLLRGRIRETDVKRLRKAFIDPQAADQSYDQIMANASEMKKLTKMEAITTAKGPGGQALQPWMFMGLQVNDYVNLVNSGLLTKTEAHDWAERVNPPQ
jgi:hypothetical protein